VDAKYAIFFLVVLLGVPMGALGCILWRPLRHVVLVLMVWSTCIPETVGINFFSREFYRTTTRGLEVSLADLCALILLAALLTDPVRRFRWFLPLTIPCLIYLGFVLISWGCVGENPAVPARALLVPYPVFEVKLYPWFEIAKFLRGFVIYLVVANYARDDTDFYVFAVALGLVVFCMGSMGLYHRYILGINRVRVSFGHANSYATYMAMMGAVMLALAIHSRGVLSGALWLGLTGAAGISVILTISRGGLIAFCSGLGLVSTFVLPRYVTVKNVLLPMVGAVAAIAILLKSLETLTGRFDADTTADMEYRGLYNQQARLMVKEHPFGVGMGNFSALSWVRYGEMVDSELTPGTPPHNILYMTLGELGYPGVLSFALIWARFYWLALPLLLRLRTGIVPALAAGSVVATIVSHIQNFLHMTYRETPMYFMMQMFVGIAVAARFRLREDDNRVKVGGKGEGRGG
jgi:hypothetical protein